jgi:prophage DNA circulation protein
LSWEDRIGEAAYTSPGGTRMRFAFTDVSVEIDKRTAAFEFPGVPGAYIQDNGHGERRFPLLCIFSGAECDAEAKAFEDLLLETGTGLLEHPVYGRRDVVPFGTLTRRDDLVSAANQSVWEVVFWSTIGAVYPSSGISPKHEVTEAVRLAKPALSSDFGRTMSLGTEARRANAKLTIRDALRKIQSTVGAVSAATESVNREFRDLQSQINFGIDVLIGQPLLLAQQMLNLISAPARAAAGIASRLDGYRKLLDRMIESSTSSPGDTASLERIRVALSNDFHANDLIAAGAVLGSVTSVLENTFTAKPGAIEAAEAIIVQASDFTGWRDGRTGDLGQIDTGEGYQALQEAVALAVGYLVEISFTLVPERAVVLDRPRGLVELCGELYGAVTDERLDFLISTNGLTGSEILELPRRRRVVYYA